MGGGILKTLKCEKCDAYMGELRDATVRTDLVVYCTPCHADKIRRKSSPPLSSDLFEVLGLKRKGE